MRIVFMVRAIQAVLPNHSHRPHLKAQVRDTTAFRFLYSPIRIGKETLA